MYAPEGLLLDYRAGVCYCMYSNKPKRVGGDPSEFRLFVCFSLQKYLWWIAKSVNAAHSLRYLNFLFMPLFM